MLPWVQENRDRLGSAGAVGLIHVLLFWLLLTGLGFSPSAAVPEALKLLDIVELPPPPPTTPARPSVEKKTRKAKPKDPEGAASPANLRNTPTQIMAPPPEIRLPIPPPIPVAPAPGQGSAMAAGASTVPGPGTGAGGFGTGLGSGRFGTGTGGGGGGGRGSRARWISGSIGPDDYPDSAYRARIGGTVHLRFTVAPSGRVSNCAVTRSSGSRALDEVTCRLIRQRFRYHPARDAEGRPIAERVVGEHVWEVAPQPPDTWYEPEEEPGGSG
ncbi:MAG TPA: energy transducer TonB [Alphaproteobacteria bacterium]|nr:energy transducer TonB [Alphaproteobacteria bacterium]